MSGAGIYLGPHIKTGPNSYELAPIPIKTFRLPSFNGSNGLYINTGINDEGRRGSSLGKDKLSPLTPYIWDDFIGEHRANQSIIDSEYTEIFTRITSTVSNEIEQRKQYAKAGQQLTQIDATKKDQETTINTIRLKEKEYQSQIDSAHSLYGQNPCYLMKELPFRKVVDGVNSVPPDLLGAYAAIDRAYRSALELKRLSLENNILSSHLPGLAKKLSQAEAESQAEPAQMLTRLVDRLYATNAEKDIRIQLLPHFLQGEIVATTGSVEGHTHSQSLEKYKAAIDNIIARNQAAVGPYAVANPNIKLPLSKPELEALKNLVHLQVNIDLGKRWDDYHNSLLHSETVRHLTDATNAFGELIARAKESESLLEQIRLATEAEARRVAEEQTRMAEAAEAKRLAAAKKAHKEAWAGRTFPVSASAAAAGPVFTVARGNLPLNPAIASAINATLRAAVAAVIDTIAAAAAPIVGGGIALFYPSELGNSDLYSLSVPLSELAPGNTDDLHAIAAAQGEVLLSVVIGSRTETHNTKFVVTSANMASVPGVPVRLATLDPHGNFYRSPNATAPNLTWTPIVKPGNASTLLPAGAPNVTFYNGPSAVALDHRIDRHPELDRYSFGGFVTVFPIESGIPPIYTVFNSPYEGATTKGEYSGRDFNAEQAGGPILELDWRTATITQEGIDAVKLHIARLDQSDANDMMVQRLEKILNGYSQLTDTDLRYYTHEMRELERFRALGLSDGFKPERGSPVWNSTHTATLEDYKLSSDDSQLYSLDAIHAGNRQIARIYEQLLKGNYE